MRSLVGLIFVALGCGGAKDECGELKAKLRPVIQKMFADLGEPLSDARLEEMLAETCAPGDGSQARAFRTCVLEADGDAEVGACLSTAMQGYASHTRDRLDRVTKKLDALDAKLRALDDDLRRRATDDAGAGSDAAVAGPAVAGPGLPPPLPPIDPATLPEWPVPAGGKPGVETEIHAADAPVDTLAVMLVDRRRVLAAAHGGTVTGHVVAPSREAALAALVAQAKLDLPDAKLRGGGPHVDLQFAAAPQRDLMRLLADVMRTNIVVAPGDLPDVNIVVKRVGAGAVLDGLAKLDDRALVRAGNTAFVLPKDTTLPPVAKLPGKDKLRLTIHDGTAAEAIRAVQAIAPLPLSACGGEKLTLRLRDVTPAEAARAIAVAAGVELQPEGACPGLAVIAHPGEPGTLVATAIGKTKRAAILRQQGATGVVHGSPTVEVLDTAIVVGGTTTQFPGPARAGPYQHATPWIADHRISAVIRTGTERQVIATSRDGTHSLFDPEHARFTLPFLFESADPIVDTNGLRVTVSPADPRSPPRTVLVPLRK